MAEENKNNLTDEEIDEQEDNADQNGGSASGNDDSKSGGDGGNKSGGSDKKGKTFTQEQVTKISTREKNQGRAAAFKELGIDPKDTKTMNLVKAFLNSQKTDDEKAADEKAETKRRSDEQAHRLAVAEAKAEAMVQGANSQHIDDIVTLALAKTGDDSDLKTVIGELKTKYPVWFGKSDEDDDSDNKGKGKTGQRGTGSSVSGKDKGNKQGGDKGQGMGARLAAQRTKSSGKKSYWGANK